MTYIFLKPFPNSFFQGSDDSVEANAFDDIKSLIKVNAINICAHCYMKRWEFNNVKENDFYIWMLNIGCMYHGLHVNRYRIQITQLTYNIGHILYMTYSTLQYSFHKVYLTYHFVHMSDFHIYIAHTPHLQIVPNLFTLSIQIEFYTFVSSRHIVNIL